MMDRYAVVGNPIAHSKSPEIHAEFARQTNQSLTYATLLAPLDSFRQTIETFFESGGKGLNVTVPFKLEAHRCADNLSDRARSAGAVNTLSYSNNLINGDNTDGIGLVRDISQNLRFRIQGSRILLLGAGGAARGVLFDLLAQSPARITIANRTLPRANEIVESFSEDSRLEAIGLHELKEREFDLLINATSSSLQNEIIPISSKAFARDALAYDMMYGKNAIPFLEMAKQNGAQTADGLGMLVEQAAESFFIWRGVRPDTVPVFNLLRKRI